MGKQSPVRTEHVLRPVLPLRPGPKQQSVSRQRLHVPCVTPPEDPPPRGPLAHSRTCFAGGGGLPMWLVLCDTPCCLRLDPETWPLLPTCENSLTFVLQFLSALLWGFCPNLDI